MVLVDFNASIAKRPRNHALASSSTVDGAGTRNLGGPHIHLGWPADGRTRGVGLLATGCAQDANADVHWVWDARPAAVQRRQRCDLLQVTGCHQRDARLSIFS